MMNFLASVSDEGRIVNVLLLELVDVSFHTPPCFLVITSLKGNPNMQFDVVDKNRRVELSVAFILL